MVLAKAALLSNNLSSQEGVDDYNNLLEDYKKAVWGEEEQEEKKAASKSLEEQFEFLFRGPDKKIKTLKLTETN